MDYGQHLNRIIDDDDDDEDEDTYTLPTKRFESDNFRHTPEEYYPDKFQLWRPTKEQYNQYEKMLWKSEFRKLLEEDNNSMNSSDVNANKNSNVGDTKRESWSSIDLTDSEMDEDEPEFNSRWSDDDEIMSENRQRSTVEHPLLIPEVIEHIIGYLDFHHDRDTLESCQQVCQVWNDVCSKKLEQFESEESFKISNILKFAEMKIDDETLKSVVPRQCHWFNIKLPPKKPTLVESVFKNIGRQMRELDVIFKNKTHKKADRIDDESNSNESANSDLNQDHVVGAQNQDQDQIIEANNNNFGDLENIGDFLENYCPHLEKLKLWLSTPSPEGRRHYPQSIFSSKDQKHFLPLKQLETEDDLDDLDFVDEGKTRIFEELINASPLLESLSFQHERTELIVKVLRIIAKEKGRLQNLTSLECYMCDLSEEFINFFLRYKWNLHHINIAFKKEVSIVKIRTFLNHLKDSLTSLVLLYKGPEYDPSLPVEDNWVIPLSMKSLKHLEVAPNVFPNACRFLVNALQLPNLKTCKFTSTISWNEHFFEGMWQRNRIKTAKEPSLRVFEIPCSCLDASIFLQEPNPFKAVSELVLDSPSIKVIQAIFLSLVNLERLKIFELYSLSNYTWDDIMTGYFDDLRGRDLIWDEVFTGKKRPMYSIEYTLEAEPLIDGASDVPSIRNLSKLKSLLLDFKSSHQKISDFFIYQGLIHLTQLQHVDINRHSFTEDAIAALKEKVFQFCHLELGADSSDSISDEF